MLLFSRKLFHIEDDKSFIETFKIDLFGSISDPYHLIESPLN